MTAALGSKLWFEGSVDFRIVTAPLGRLSLVDFLLLVDAELARAHVDEEKETATG